MIDLFELTEGKYQLFKDPACERINDTSMVQLLCRNGIIWIYSDTHLAVDCKKCTGEKILLIDDSLITIKTQGDIDWCLIFPINPRDIFFKVLEVMHPKKKRLLNAFRKAQESKRLEPFQFKLHDFRPNYF